jgi:hypothetical protein
MNISILIHYDNIVVLHVSAAAIVYLFSRRLRGGGDLRRYSLIHCFAINVSLIHFQEINVSRQCGYYMEWQMIDMMY